MVRVLGTREDTSYSILPELSLSELTIHAHEEDSVLCCSMEADVEDLVADGASLLLDSCSSSDDSEYDSDENQYEAVEQQSPESPSPPDISYLSFANSERSAHNVHGQLETCEPPVPAPTDVQPWHGYSIYGDNIDKNVHPRHQTVSSKTTSLHMFHSFANFDRVNLAGVSDEAPSPTGIDPTLLMPSASDRQAIISRFVVMISR